MTTFTDLYAPVATPAGVDSQVAMLRAGVELVSRVGTVAALSLTISPQYVSSLPGSLSAQVTAGTAGVELSSSDQEWLRLENIRAVAAILGGSLAVAYDDTDHLNLQVVGVTIADVPVEIYIVLYQDVVRAEARALVAADGGSR